MARWRAVGIKPSLAWHLMPRAETLYAIAFRVVCYRQYGRMLFASGPYAILALVR